MHSAAIALLLALTVGVADSKPAHAFRKIAYGPEHFFDLKQAQGYWRDLKTVEQFDAAYAACKAGPYGAWEGRFELWNPGLSKDEWVRAKSVMNLEEDLEKSPDAKAIKACYDLRQSWYVFHTFHNAWSGGKDSYPWPWNDPSCKSNYMHELMAVRCDQVPDWRDARTRADDDKYTAKAIAKRKAKGQ